MPGAVIAVPRLEPVANGITATHVLYNLVFFPSKFSLPNMSQKVTVVPEKLK